MVPVTGWRKYTISKHETIWEILQLIIIVWHSYDDNSNSDDDDDDDGLLPTANKHWYLGRNNW